MLAISELIEDSSELLRTCAAIGLYPGRVLSVAARDSASLRLRVLSEHTYTDAPSAAERLEHELRDLPASPDDAAALGNQHALAQTLARNIWVVREEQQTP